MLSHVFLILALGLVVRRTGTSEGMSPLWIPVTDLPDRVEAPSGPRPVSVSTHEVPQVTPRPLYDATKRVMDVTLSLLSLCLLGPLLLLIAAAVKWEDGGPVLFSQVRAGLDGRQFRLYKFRSMCVDAEDQWDALRSAQGHASPRFKMGCDPRVLRTGRWLRRFSLDELPQLWNVVLGDLSLVGPRPALPEEVAEYGARHRQRLSVIPGLTCIWQVSGRSMVPFEQQVEMDLTYMRTRSLLLDVQLILRTVPAVLAGRGAC